MWRFSHTLISMNRPQSFSALIAHLDMTGYSANYLLGKRLFGIERWCKFSRGLFLPVYCSRMFWGLTGTQRWLFIGIQQLLCLSCCTIECIDFVTKLMKHAFSSQRQCRAPAEGMEALSSSEERGVWGHKWCTHELCNVWNTLWYVCMFIFLHTEYHV